MRILLIHRYFWPDTPPYAVILNEMAKMLVRQGHVVEVLSSQPSYKSIDAQKKRPFSERSEGGFHVYRLPVFNEVKSKMGKLLNFLLFPLMVFFFVLFRPRYNLVTVSSAPPVVLAFFVALAVKIKRSALIYHCMDMHPEIGRLSGEFKNSLLYRLLLSMEHFTCGVARYIIVLSQDMKRSIAQRKLEFAEKSRIINNFSLPSDVENNADIEHLLAATHSRKRLVFAGNIGRFQGLDILVDALKSFHDRDQIELVFVGEGAYLSRLKQQAAGLDNVIFLPHQSVSTAKQLIQTANFGVVSLHNDVIRYAYPSKTMVYLECGVPILLLSNKGSEMAKFIESYHLGYFASNKNTAQIHEVFERIVDASDSLLQGDVLTSFYQQQFAKAVFEQKFIELVDTVNGQ